MIDFVRGDKDVKIGFKQMLNAPSSPVLLYLFNIQIIPIEQFPRIAEEKF
jgi:hypothetical protein